MSARYATQVKVFFLSLAIALAPVAQAKILIRPNGVAPTSIKSHEAAHCSSCIRYLFFSSSRPQRR